MLTFTSYVNADIDHVMEVLTAEKRRLEVSITAESLAFYILQKIQKGYTNSLLSVK